MACHVCAVAVDGVRHLLNEALGDGAGDRSEKWIEVVQRDGKRFRVRISWDLHAACEEIPRNAQLECEQRIVVQA